MYLTKKSEIEHFDQIALFPREKDFPLFDLITIHKSKKVVYFVSIKIIKPNTIRSKLDVKFLLKPLNKGYRKGIKEEEKKQEDIVRKESIIDKLKDYCAATKKYFGKKLAYRILLYLK